MRLSKDKTSLAVNSSLTLEGIPPETFEYRLGNRSALEKNDSLFIEATNALAEIWVRDYPPFCVSVASTWIRRLASNLPPGDFVFLKLKGNRVYLDGFSQVCKSGTSIQEMCWFSVKWRVGVPR
jgi:hypothetical protein